MKSIRLYLLLVIFVTGNTQAQERKFSLNTNVLNLIIGGPSLALNYDIPGNWSIQVYASTGRFNITKYSFKTGIVDFKYHVSKNIYVGPYLRYIEKTINQTGFVDRTGFFSIPGRDFQGRGLSSGASLGFNILNKKRLNIESFVGAGYGKFISQKGDKTEPGFFDARIGILTGIRF